MTFIRALPEAAATGRIHTSRTALRVFDQFKCTKILDVGCGSAYFEEAQPRRFVGMDIEPQRILAAVRRGVHGVFIGTGLRIPAGDAQFDGVLAKDVLEHLYLNEAFTLLEEVRRVLTPGGIFITVTFKAVQSFWDKPDHVRPYSNKWVQRVMTQEMNAFDVVLKREYSAGLRGFGKLGFENVAHALAHHLHFHSDHGLIALRKRG